MAAGRDPGGGRSRQRPLGRRVQSVAVARRRGRRHPAPVAGRRARSIFERQISGTDLVLQAPLTLGMGYGISSPEMPIGPNERTCFWGGWGGSIVVNDLENRLTVAYVMNRMGEGTTGDDRGIGIAVRRLRRGGRGATRLTARCTAWVTGGRTSVARRDRRRGRAGRAHLRAGAAVQGAVGFGANLVAAPLLVLLDDGFVPGPVIVASGVLNLLVTWRSGRGAVDPTVNMAIAGQVVGVARWPARSSPRCRPTRCRSCSRCWCCSPSR